MKDYIMSPGEIRAKEILLEMMPQDPVLQQHGAEFLDPRSPGYLLDRLAWHLARTAPSEQALRLRELVMPLLIQSREAPRLYDGRVYRCWSTRQVIRYFWRFRCREATYRLLPANQQESDTVWEVKTFQKDGDWVIEIKKGGRDYLYLLTHSNEINLRAEERQRQMLQFLHTDERIWLSENE